ncbi:DUF1206 domain-containing protein [Agreia sp. COWG]|uniref:DUF1206 domain-containing protein n=1 Tax=Agreia sp. COWG TaxID=2773266 RepID=UPI00192907DC|nr:DUF1206 domain-containing protein [Agreia sp. COWG]
MRTSHQRASRRDRNTRRFRRTARGGYAVNGLIHFLIGAIAIGVALGDTSGNSVDQAGALHQLAAAPVGLALLWAATTALLTLAVWQATTVALIDDANIIVRWGKRFSEAGKGLFYLALGTTTLLFALGGTTSSSAAISNSTDILISTDQGSAILAVLGLCLVGGGIGFVSIGIRRSFRKLIRVPAGWTGRLVTVLGIIGYIANGIALALVGGLAVLGALSRDPDQPMGLDGALRSLAALPFGTILLSIVGLGFVSYGFFLIARAKLAKL